MRIINNTETYACQLCFGRVLTSHYDDDDDDDDDDDQRFTATFVFLTYTYQLNYSLAFTDDGYAYRTK